jgi:uncharacterized UPF0160 family protein
MNWLINRKTVAVHSGNFHGDDVFSVAVLSLYLGYFPKIIRTRDEVKINQADFALDVGERYDPTRNFFDHHLIGGVGKRDNGIPYATFGLVWKEFGEKICESKEIALMVDRKLVAFMDADDSAVELCREYLFGVRPYTISDFVIYKSLMTNDKDRDSVFKKMVIWAKDIIEMEIVLAKKLSIEQKKVRMTYDFSSDKRVIILDGDYAWEDVLSAYSEPLFVIKPSVSAKSWKIYAVKREGSKFENRLDLPTAWAGLRNEALAKITGVADAEYCHHQRYMAIAGSKEGAVKMAELALKEINNKK